MTPRLEPDFLSKPLAHRGLHDVADGRPENSRAAIRAAVSYGYGVEIDLQLSADNHAMVFHDYELNRLRNLSYCGKNNPPIIARRRELCSRQFHFTGHYITRYH
jgi:glycerophosphoryl diester phosphodiesterase